MTYWSESPKDKGQPGPGLARGQLWPWAAGLPRSQMCKVPPRSQMCKVPPCLFLAQMGPLSAPGAAGLNLACPPSLGRCFTSSLPSPPVGQPKGAGSGGG